MLALTLNFRSHVIRVSSLVFHTALNFHCQSLCPICRFTTNVAILLAASWQKDTATTITVLCTYVHRYVDLDVEKKCIYYILRNFPSNLYLEVIILKKLRKICKIRQFMRSRHEHIFFLLPANIVKNYHEKTILFFSNQPIYYITYHFIGVYVGPVLYGQVNFTISLLKNDKSNKKTTGGHLFAMLAGCRRY